MSDRPRGDNVWGSSRPADRPPQRWPAHPAPDPTPRPSRGSVAAHRTPEALPSGRPRAASVDLVWSAVLAVVALLVLLLAFEVWDRPVDAPASTEPTTTTVTSPEATDEG